MQQHHRLICRRIIPALDDMELDDEADSAVDCDGDSDGESDDLAPSRPCRPNHPTTDEARQPRPRPLSSSLHYGGGLTKSGNDDRDRYFDAYPPLSEPPFASPPVSKESKAMMAALAASERVRGGRRQQLPVEDEDDSAGGISLGLSLGLNLGNYLPEEENHDHDHHEHPDGDGGGGGRLDIGLTMAPFGDDDDDDETVSVSLNTIDRYERRVSRSPRRILDDLDGVVVYPPSLPLPLLSPPSRFSLAAAMADMAAEEEDEEDRHHHHHHHHPRIDDGNGERGGGGGDWDDVSPPPPFLAQCGKDDGGGGDGPGDKEEDDGGGGFGGGVATGDGVDFSINKSEEAYDNSDDGLGPFIEITEEDDGGKNLNGLGYRVEVWERQPKPLPTPQSAPPLPPQAGKKKVMWWDLKSVSQPNVGCSNDDNTIYTVTSSLSMTELSSLQSPTLSDCDRGINGSRDDSSSFFSCIDWAKSRGNTPPPSRRQL